MRILFYDNREVAQEVGETLGWELAGDINAVFARSHVLSLHLSATDGRGRSNAGLIQRENLLSFGSDTDRPGPRIFINAARSSILNDRFFIFSSGVSC